MNVTLTPQMESRIRDWIESGQFANAEAVIDRALQVMDEQEHARLVRARELVIAGFASGNGVELTEELMDEIERHSEERFQRGENPGDHVRP